MSARGKYFFLKNPDCGLVIDITDKKTGVLAKTGLWRQKYGEDLDNQLWYFHHYTGTIRSKMNDFCLDCKDNEIVMNPFDVNDTNRWTVMGNRIHVEGRVDLVIEAAEAFPQEGCLLRLGKYEGDENQHWQMIYTDPPCFFIRSKLNDKVLDVMKANRLPRAPVIMHDQGDKLQHNQLWYEDGYGYIRSKLNDFALDVIEDESGSYRIVLNPFNADDENQRWVNEGEFIVNHSRNAQVLDIVEAEKKSNAEICPCGRHGNNNQRWEIDYIERF